MDDNEHNEDKGLFQRYMKDVKRIRDDIYDLAASKRKKTVSERDQTSEDEEDENLPYLHDKVTESVSALDSVSFNRSGVSEKLLRRLRRGKIPIQARFDFHGLKTSEAQKELMRFLKQNQRSSQTCVLIITGKGSHSSEPVLKNRLNNWLRQCDEVIAFTSARPLEGGTGAMYVLLKRVS